MRRNVKLIPKKWECSFKNDDKNNIGYLYFYITCLERYSRSRVLTETQENKRQTI